LNGLIEASPANAGLCFSRQPLIQSMKRSILAMILALAGFFLSGCKTTSRSDRPAAGPIHRLATAEAEETAGPLQESALELRVKAFAHFASGISFELNDQPNVALEHYFESAKTDSTNESLVLDVARRLIQRKQLDRAIELLKQAAEQPDASGKLMAWLASAYTEAGQNEQAIQANQEALKRDPQSVMAYRSLSQLFLEQRQPQQALAVLDQAASQPAEDPAFWVDLAELYANHSRLHPNESELLKPKVLKALDRAAELKPQNLLVIQKLADGFKLMGELSKAEPLYLELLDRFPELSGLREKLAEIYLREGRKDKASDQLEAIVKSNPRNEQAYYFLGSIAHEEKKFAEAEEFFEKALWLKPAFEPVYYDLAGLKIMRNKPQEALDLLEKARARFKPNFRMEYYTGLAYTRAKRYAESIRHFVEAEVLAKANEPASLNHTFFYQMGAAYERKGDYAEAEKYFRKCLELSPNFAEAMNYLGYMWAERGENLEAARKLIEKAVELEPKNAAYLDSLGWVLFKLKQPREALDWLQRAIGHAEEPDPTLYDHLGDIHSELGDLESARAAWRKAIDIEANEQIQKKLDAAPPGTGPRE
jgi:tetratricopeptide (TPR) repeat protein